MKQLCSTGKKSDDFRAGFKKERISDKMYAAMLTFQKANVVSVSSGVHAPGSHAHYAIATD